MLSAHIKGNAVFHFDHFAYPLKKNFPKYSDMPVNDALEVMVNLMAPDTKFDSLDDTRVYIKALAPWFKDD